MNKCMFVGNFVHDPRLNIHSKSDTHKVPFTNFRLAIPHRFKKSNKEVGSHTAFLDFECFDSAAEVICNNYKKGDPILIEAMVKTYRDNEDSSKVDVVFRVERFEPLPKVERSNNAENTTTSRTTVNS